MNAKLKFHNLAYMWLALCDLVDGRSDRPLLAVDSTGHEEYTGGRISRPLAIKGVAMSMKIEECPWGTITCQIAKEQATPVGTARPSKGGDPTINITTAGRPKWHPKATSCSYPITAPTHYIVASLWGMGYEERTRGGGGVTFTLQVDERLIQQAMQYKGL